MKDFIEFPDPNLSDDEGLIAYGGNLSPEMLLSAYLQGIFPWFNDDSEILWWSPNPRMVLYPQNLKISKSFRKTLLNQQFECKINTQFTEVISRCSSIKRKNQDGTWITNNMIEAYSKLNKLGFALSFETYLNTKLVGGLYGLRLGSIFFGESMFSEVSDSSKFALYHLCQWCMQEKIRLIDVQQSTNHLRSLGAADISRKEFIELVKKLAWPKNQ
jgi:leucyl/phenylalanyl-tRNA--protein transferase